MGVDHLDVIWGLYGTPCIMKMGHCKGSSTIVKMITRSAKIAKIVNTSQKFVRCENVHMYGKKIEMRALKMPLGRNDSQSDFRTNFICHISMRLRGQVSLLRHFDVGDTFLANPLTVGPEL